MNTNDSIHRALLAISTCLLLGLNTAVLAQDTKVIPEGETAVSGFDIVISDGVFTYKGETIKATLENVVDMLRDRHPEANIIVTPGIPKMRIGDLKIRASDLQVELEALQVASGERFTVRLRGSSDNWLYVLEPVPVPPEDKLCVEAFGLGGYFASLPQADDPNENAALIRDKIGELERIVDETVAIYNAIDEDVHGQTGGRRAGVNVRFHRGANLLILIGDPQSVEIAGKVIGALPHVQRSGGVRDYPGGLDIFGGRRSGGRTSGYGLDSSPAAVNDPAIRR